MARVIGVRFRDNGKIYYFASEQFEVEVGQNVIVETARGVEYGRVVLGNREIHDEKIIATLKRVVQITTTRVLFSYENNKEKKKRKKQVCIDPDSIIGKEIMYQTALLHEILHEIRGGRTCSKETNHSQMQRRKSQKTL